jgi:hypothetical protein
MIRKPLKFSNFILRVTVHAALFAVFSGCSGAVQYTLTPDYNDKMPRTIAVMPVGGDISDKDAQYLFRTMAYEKLIRAGYSPIPLEVIDDMLLRSGMRRDGLYKINPKELASILDADSILYTTVTKWNPTVFLSYASMKIGAKLELYDGASGEKLLESEFETKDSDMSLERNVVEFGVIKTYEPVIQRVIDAIFSTMPAAKKIAVKGKPQKNYYDWLP